MGLILSASLPVLGMRSFYIPHVTKTRPPWSEQVMPRQISVAVIHSQLNVSQALQPAGTGIE